MCFIIVGALVFLSLFSFAPTMSKAVVDMLDVVAESRSIGIAIWESKESRCANSELSK
jgi:hypothetical protein